MKYQFSPCSEIDLDILIEISKQTFWETYKHLNTDSNMEEYLSQAFSSEKIRTELRNPFSYFFMLVVEGEYAGYLKVNEHTAQTESQKPDSLEVERIYLFRPYQGTGLGKALLAKSIEVATGAVAICPP